MSVENGKNKSMLHKMRDDAIGIVFRWTWSAVNDDLWSERYLHFALPVEVHKRNPQQASWVGAAVCVHASARCSSSKRNL